MPAAPRGLLAPFRRDRQRDFAAGDGDSLLASKIEQVLATDGESERTSGELPWRTAFGGLLGLLRHQNNDAALAALSRVYVRDALRKWVPEAELIAVDVVCDGPELALRVRYRAAGEERVALLRWNTRTKDVGT